MRKIILKSGRTLEITQDEHPDNPRNWDNVASMVCFHNRYRLGDNLKYKDSESLLMELADTEDSLTEPQYIEIIEKTHVILPLFLYDHSGLRISTGQFSCRFDSSQVGYVYISLKHAAYTWNTPEDWNHQMKDDDGFINLREFVTRVVKHEVDIYNQYLAGEVYCFELIEHNTCLWCETKHRKVIDRCGGFYGDNIRTNGMLDHLPEEDHPADFEKL